MCRALGRANGLAVTTNDAEQLRVKAYRVRQEARSSGDNSFDALQFHISPDGDGKLWIVKIEEEEEEESA